MTTQEIIKKMRNCAKRDWCHDCSYYIPGKHTACENGTLLDAADHLEQLETQLTTVTAERDKAVEFIRYLDKQYSNYMSEEERFSKWRKQGKDGETNGK